MRYPVFDVLQILCFSCDHYLADIYTRNTLGDASTLCHAGSFIRILSRLKINNDVMIENYLREVLVIVILNSFPTSHFPYLNHIYATLVVLFIFYYY